MPFTSHAPVRQVHQWQVRRVHEIEDRMERKFTFRGRFRSPALPGFSEFALAARTSFASRTLLNIEFYSRFRWVYCQVQELNRSKSSRPNAVKAALLALPKTLDETYERMLSRIDTDDQADALTLLRWLAFSYEPLTLEQLAEARVIDPTDDPDSDGIVDIENKGDWQDTLDILAGLVITVADGQHDEKGLVITVVDGQHDEKGPIKKPSLEGISSGGSSIDRATSRGTSTGEDDVDEHSSQSTSNSDKHVVESSSMGDEDGAQEPQSAQVIHEGTIVRLAHFSVKEYLQSSRIKEKAARAYHLDTGREHWFLTRSCLTYLTYYSESRRRHDAAQEHNLDQIAMRSPAMRQYRVRRLRGNNFNSFPLLCYAAKYWCSHAQEQSSRNIAREVRFLLNDVYMENFLSVHPPVEWLRPCHTNDWKKVTSTNSALPFASHHNLKEVVRALIAAGAQVDAAHDQAGTPLYAAAGGGHEAIVRVILDSGADPNLRSPGYYEFAMHVAAVHGHEAVVRLLLQSKADVNIQGGEQHTALQAAVSTGQAAMVRLLLDQGADINLLKVEGRHALYDAADKGYEGIISCLLAAGVDVNHHSKSWGPAIWAAAANGHKTIVRLFLDLKANVNLHGKGVGSALQVAAENGHEAIVRLLLDSNADSTIQGPYPTIPNTALQSAVAKGHESIVRLLLSANPVPKTSTGQYSNSGRDFEGTPQQLSIDAASDLDQALYIACKEGHEKLVQVLLDAGASVNALRGGTSALSYAATNDDMGIMQILLNVAGVQVDAREGLNQTALQFASRHSNQQVVQMLLDSGADPMLGDEDECTALIMAVGNGRKKIAQTIWKAVPDAPQEEIFAGALIYASDRFRDVKVVRRLLNDKLNVDGVTSRRQTWNEELYGSFNRCLTFAYRAAARRNYTDIMEMLVEAGADPNVPQKNWEPLFPLWKQYNAT
jgi:ankyrin repeat protein